MKREFLDVSVLALAAAWGLIAPQTARAQTANTAAPADAVSEVIVTNTRIQTLGYQAPTPTKVIGAEQFQERAAVKITDALLDIPAFFNGQTQTGFSSSGTDYINLRGLNGTAARSLVLVNGQRYVATSSTGLTDVGVIPTALIQRTDVVTGGASAAWGSDALAGVVNIVLRKSLNGLQGDLQYGQSKYGDNKQLQGALAYGSPFASGRGQFMVAGEYNRLSDPPTYGDRPWGSTQAGYTAQTINGVKYTNVVTRGLTLLNFTPGGVLTGVSTSNNLYITDPGLTPYYTATSSPAKLASSTSLPASLQGIQFGANGSPIAYANGAGNIPNAGTSSTFGVGGQGAFLTNAVQINGATKRANFYSVINYDLNNNVQLSVQGGWSYTSLAGKLNPIVEGNNTPAFTVATSNPYLQALPGTIGTTGKTLAQTLTAAGVTAVAVSRVAPEFGEAKTTAAVNVYRLSAELEGRFHDKGHWTAFGSWGRSDYDARFINDIVEANLRASLEPIVQNGQIVCNPTVVAQYGASPGCVPLNPFGPGSISAAAANYIAGTPQVQHYVNTMKAGGANFSDEPFNSWAGPVSVAGGAEWRRISLYQNTSPVFNLPLGGILTQTYLPQGFDFVAGTNGTDNGNAKNIDYHAENITEEFGEINLPVLDYKGVKANLNGAFRLEQNSVSGNTHDWKIGATVQPFKGLLFRATKSLDSRDPNLSELYTGNNVAMGTATNGTANPDPGCPNCVGLEPYANISTRNTDLKPEVGHSTTLGFSLNPSFAPGLNLSVDAWTIVIDGEISSIANVVNACYGVTGTVYAGNPQTNLCSLIYRTGGPGTPISYVLNPTFNLAVAKKRGIDYDIDYRTRLNAIIPNVPGTIDISAVATQLQLDDVQSLSIVAPTHNAGLVGFPKWRMTLNETYINGPFRFSVIEKEVGSQSFTLNNAPTNGVVPYYNNRVPSVWYVNAQVAYTVNTHKFSNLQFYANVKNLFNVAPPTIIGGNGLVPLPTNAGTNYDLIGRTFTIGVRFRH